jgi:hypothetical protein
MMNVISPRAIWMLDAYPINALEVEVHTIARDQAPLIAPQASTALSSKAAGHQLAGIVRRSVEQLATNQDQLAPQARSDGSSRHCRQPSRT